MLLFVLDVYSPGSQTAATLTFAVYLLASNPDVMRKLRKEIIEHVGLSNYPTSDDFREMKYLRAVINETLRFVFFFQFTFAMLLN